MPDFPEAPLDPAVRGPDKHAGPAAAKARNGVLYRLFQFRYWLHGIVFVAAFCLSWATSGQSGAQRIWLSLPIAVSQHTAVLLQSATVAITVLAVLAAAAGAALRTWGAAYLGTGVVVDPRLRSDAVISVGPFGHLRNPLYVGTTLHALALCVLLNWIAAAFLVVIIIALQAALIVAEERYLSKAGGEDYAVYARNVPRLIPRLTAFRMGAQVPAAWGRAFLGEIYMWGVAASFAMFGATYNATLVIQGIVVAFGISIVVRGLMAER